MSSGKNTPVNIPVNRESRSFEKHRRDMLSNLERNIGSGEVRNQVASNNGSGGIAPFHNNWIDELDGWMNASWNRLDDEMRRMRNSMFALLVS